jgi:PAS domain S-box-containing protein
MTEGDAKFLGGDRAQSTVLSTKLLQYGVALLSVVLALATNLLLQSYLEPTPTSVFFAAVMVSAWYGGLGPGLLATLLSTLAVNYFYIEPFYSFNLNNAAYIVQLSIFVLAALLINSLNQAQRSAKRKAEASLQALREKEIRFSRLAQSGIIGTIVADLNGAIIDANDAFLQMLGYTREDLCSGRIRWQEMTPPEYLDVSERSQAELRLNGVCTPFEKEYIRKDGTHVSILLGSIMLDETTVMGFVLDITERKQVEKALRQSETTLNALIASSPIGIAFFDRNLHYIHANEALAATNGIPLKDHIGRTLVEVLPQWEPIITPILQRVMETNEPLLNQELVGVTHPSDLVRYALVNYFPVCLPDGEVLGVGVTSVDISDRRQMEESLRQSEERYRYLAELIPQLVWTANAEGLLLDVNQRWLDFTGLTLEQAQTAGWQEIVYPDDIPILNQHWNTAQHSGVHYQAEGRMRRADGVYRWHLHQAVPLKTEQGEILRWFGTATDIEDLKQLQQERDRLLQQEQVARAEAETANRIKDEFLAVLSHELRSPLNPILGWSRLLQTQKLDEQRTQQALATIERNAKLQTQLIEDLLDVSRILRGKLVLNIAPVSLISTIEAALETVKLAVEAKGIHIQKEFNLEVDQVMGDAARLQQVMWNLLSNAVKFTPNGGRVEVKLSLFTGHSSSVTHHSSLEEGNLSAATNDQERITNYAQITVTDTGKGISPDFLPYVFDYFRQEDGTTTRKFGGLGLGLAIVRHITELHGGTVRAESPGEGLGATFIVQLPLIPVLMDVDEPEETPTVISLSGLRVLAVDDDDDIRALIEFILQQAGAEVRVVASVTEALQQLETFSPELLISDIGMPDQDGYTLIRQVRTLTSEQGMIPAIALTAYAGEIDQQEAIAAGFQMHLAKPVEPEKLINAIVTLLNENKAGDRE